MFRIYLLLLDCSLLSVMPSAAAYSSHRLLAITILYLHFHLFFYCLWRDKVMYFENNFGGAVVTAFYCWWQAVVIKMFREVRLLFSVPNLLNSDVLDHVPFSRAGANGFGVCKTTSHASLNIQNYMFSILFTDNIFAIKSWAKRKFGFEESRIDKSFGIPEDFDYID